MAKVWLITLQTGGKEPQILEEVTGRKKIGFFDAYLCDVFEEHYPGVMQRVHLKASIKHLSGTKVVLTTPTAVLSASLEQAEN